MKSGTTHRPTFWILLAALVVLILLVLFFSLARSVQTAVLLSFDNRIMEWTYSISNPALTKFMLFITWLGNVEVLATLTAVVIIVLLFKRKYVEGIYFACTAAATSAFNIGLKNWLQRERPDVVRIIEATGFSFPSGHTMGAIAIYGMLGWLAARHLPSPAGKWIIGASSALLIVLIGYSRIYLGVHYPSDIIAGLAAGGSLLIVSQLLLRGAQIIRHKP